LLVIMIAEMHYRGSTPFLWVHLTCLPQGRWNVPFGAAYASFSCTGHAIAHISLSAEASP
jgi:hypothetical protein